MPSDGMRARVIRRRAAADGIVELVLAGDEGTLPTWAPGAHIDLRCCGFERQYSLCGEPSSATWRIAILREPGGRGGSQHFHETLAVGSRVEISVPRNHFQLEPAPEYLFLAGGIGITPILSMITSVDGYVPWRLAYGGRSLSTMAFRSELPDRPGRVSVWPRDTHGSPVFDQIISESGPGSLIYCCGPQRMIRAVESAALAAGRSGSVRIERFVAHVPVDTASDVEFEVVLAQTGGTLTVRADRTILETLEGAGIDVFASCREGICGSCQTRVLSGLPDHRDSYLSDGERGPGGLMAVCVSRAITRSLELDV